MTLKELKNKLDKLSKAYKDETEILIISSNSQYSPKAIVSRSYIMEDGKEIEKIYIEIE